MFRTVTAVVAVVAAALIGPPTRADEEAIKVGEKFEGELTEMKGYPHWPGYVDTFAGYAAEVPISLKAGQKLSITATVIGKGRKVSVCLLDPTRKIVAASARSTAVKSVQLTAEEVNATGRYTIAVISDQIGAFTVQTAGPSAEKLDEKALEDKIRQLKQDLKKAEDQLEALRKKQKKQ